MDAPQHAPSTDALQIEADGSQPYQALQSQVQSPAVAERFQFPETDCEEAVEWAFASEIVPPQTSCTQESEAHSTHQDTHETETSEAAVLAKLQVAVPVLVPIASQVQERTLFVTVADEPWANAGVA